MWEFNYVVEETDKLDFDDVMIVPKPSRIGSRSQVSLWRNYVIRDSRILCGIPIMSANMNSVTTTDAAYLLNRFSMHPISPKNEPLKHPWTIHSYGMDFKTALENEEVICLDVANGYMEKFLDYIKDIRARYPKLIIIAGNVVTAEGTKNLIEAGADIVKVGIGSGSACSTRLKTGVGYPQLSAVLECSAAADEYENKYIISDGGCRTPGDIAKAFAAGADFVCLGGMLAGHDENGAHFYGMSSEHANRVHSGGLKGYRCAEGWEMQLPSRGPLAKTLEDILGGLRSACSYVGAVNLDELRDRAEFILVNRQANTSLWEYRR